MHQDQRIGLALGVLLVGACAAFFFRNETRTVPPALRLQHAEELDERIAERTTTPYLKGIEAVEASDRRRQRAADPSHSADDSTDSASYWSPLSSTQDSHASSMPGRDSQLRPKSSDSEEFVEFAPITVPNELRPASEQTSPHLPGASRGTEDRATDVRTHVVQKGETLSSIAAKTLGSSGRYHDLFEANRDQLSDPNDVKLGMTLRIPTNHGESTVKSQVVKARKAPNLQRVPDDATSISEEAAVPLPRDMPLEIVPPTVETPISLPIENDSGSVSIPIPPALPNDSVIDLPEQTEPADDSNSPSKKFVPSRRTPLPGRPIGPQANILNRNDSPVRRLSQIPPDALSGKIAR